MAALNLEAINAMRVLNGQTTLTELPKGEADGDNNEGKNSVDEAKKAADKLQADKDEAARLLAEKDKSGTATEDQELSDEQLLKLLEKKGIKAATLADLTQKEVVDPEKEKEDREIAKLTYGLNKGKFTKKQYDSFVSDKNDPKNLYYAKYHAEAKAEDAALTDEEIEQEFIAEHGLDADQKSRKYKNGQEKISLMADKLLRDKYGNIISIDQEYEAYDKQQRSKADFEKKVIASAPVYKKDLQDVFKDLKKITTKFEDGQEYEVAALDESIKSIEETMTEPKFVASQIGNGYTKENLKKTAWLLFLDSNLPYLLKEVANQHLNKHAAGTKGIPLLGGSKKNEDNIDESTLSEAARAYRSLNKKPEPANN